jgi:threonine dehydratase
MNRSAELFPTRSALQEAHDRTKPWIQKTPVVTCAYFDEQTGANLYFKCENFQKTGSFKIRGVLNTVLGLDPAQTRHGLATFSSGNHARAVAYVASLHHLPSFIAMPATATKIKIAALKEYGAHLCYFNGKKGHREDVMARLLRKTDASFIHPYNAMDTIIGQSGVAKELIEEIFPPLDSIVVPVGGGGLLAGTALAAAHFSPKTVVFGAEPELADGAFVSFLAGRRIETDFAATIADGLRTNIGERNCAIMLKLTAGILQVAEDEIYQALLQVWHRMKIVVEPSAAVALAAVLRNPRLFQGKRIGILFSGGNLDLPLGNA